MSSTSIVPVDAQCTPEMPETRSDKISAYYSLVFPNITYYLQTLTVTIGRRTMNAATTSSESQQGQVDVDLGPLRNVSRLHAKIEWHEEEERFMLIVVGRNGAWVDGVWSCSGSKVPLGASSQIQIASRTFHFVLPPPSNGPGDSPSPCSPCSDHAHASPTDSAARARSLSVDITSLSPPTSEHTPPPQPKTKTPLCKNPRSPSLGVPKPKPSTSRKRKKADRKLTPPEVMPPKPAFTYAQLCYRAIKALDGKATLQDICGWMAENFEWYRYNRGTGWENSVRHNLSSNRAFKKMERCAGERGKGFFWSVDPNFEHMFDEHAPGASGGKKKAGSSLLETQSKRKGGVVLPPPLTTTPLAMKGITSASLTGPRNSSPPAQPNTPSTMTIKSEFQSAEIPASPAITVSKPMAHPQSFLKSVTAPTNNSQTKSTTWTPSASLPALPRIPFIVGPLPPSFKPASNAAAPSLNSSSNQPNPHESLVLHEGTLYLHPTIFADLTPEHLRALEALGMPKAIEVLKGHIVNYLREVGRKEGRSRGRGKRRGVGRGTVDGRDVDGKTKEAEKEGGTGSQDRRDQPGKVHITGKLAEVEIDCLPAPIVADNEEHREESPIVIVDDEDEGHRISKRRKVETECVGSVGE